MNSINNYFNELVNWINNVEDQFLKRKFEFPEDTISKLKNNVEKLKQLLREKPKVITENFLNTLNSEVKNVQAYMQQITPQVTVTAGIKNDGSVPIGKHILPPLPYAYNALEPYISEEIMRLHHLEHHKSYVEGLNNAELELEKARVNGDFSLVKHWERELAFHGSGHYLHAMFWENMMPNGGIIPQGEILNDINKSFGSFDKFKKHFTEAALKVEGVGWAILVWSPRSRRLEILQTEKQQLFTQWDTIPLLGLDVWEHAYYLQYKANRKEYINNWWNIVNWSNVNDRLVVAKNIKWNAV